jgi:hypothetical protein
MTAGDTQCEPEVLANHQSVLAVPANYKASDEKKILSPGNIFY